MLLTILFITFATPKLIAVPPKQATQKQVSITFDDLPVVTDRDRNAVKLEITNKLVNSIVKHKIPAVGFVNEMKIKLFDDETGEREESDTNLLRTWLQANLELGNHTYSHINLNEKGLPAYEADVVKGERITKELLKNNGKKLRYFRHPYLHTGRTEQVKQDLQQFLVTHDYIVAPVTMFVKDWIFSRAYDQAFLQHDQLLMQRIGKAYLTYTQQELDYWERQSQKLFGREIKQILLFHANTINADYFNQIAKIIKQRGYKFITLDQALTDKAYQSPDNYLGDGISWLHRWALTKGENLVLPNKPQIPDFITKSFERARSRV